ncbi:MAG: hypothetical protein ACW96X_09775 [Promethearchaeota archaeon]|jgi:hypothetical protein
MCSEVSDRVTDKKKIFNHLPNYIIINKTNWFRWLIVFLLLALVAITTFQFMITEASRNLTIAIYVLDGFLLFSPLVFGFFIKKPIRSFIIEENNPLTHENNSCNLICRFHMRKIKISSKSFQINEIKRFEVIQRMKRNNLKWFCALVLNSGEYLTITTTLDEPLTFHYAKELNNFLELNTSLDKKLMKQALIPYIPTKEQRKIKMVRSLKIMLTLIIIVLFTLLSILFWIGNIELIPGFIILVVSMVLLILFIMTTNGSTFSGL